MNTLLRLLIAVMLSGCASYGDAVSAREKKEAEFVVLGASRFAIYKDHVLHAITQNEWGKRNELGIPSDARKCDGPYYVYFKVTDGERGTVIGLVTEDNRKNSVQWNR